MIELPTDFPVIERSVVRLVVCDDAGRILLFHTHDLTAPELGEWWELPGGGIDPGETYRETAQRELREETGIVVSIEQIGAPIWRRSASFRHRCGRRLQHEVVARVQLDVPEPTIDQTGRLDYEKEDYFDYRWWPVGEILTSSAPFYPGRLPSLLASFLRGEEIDEPFELWS